MQDLKISANSADLFCIMNPWNWWKVTFLTYLIKILRVNTNNKDHNGR